MPPPDLPCLEILQMMHARICRILSMICILLVVGVQWVGVCMALIAARLLKDASARTHKTTTIVIFCEPYYFLLTRAARYSFLLGPWQNRRGYFKGNS